MTADDKTDEQLLQQFRLGDSRAFETLVRRHQDRIFRLALLWLYDDQSALDAAQEVFLRAHKGLLSFRYRSSVFTWLYRTTRNVCSEFNRRYSRTREPVDFADPKPRPGGAASKEQTTRRLQQLVANLPPRQREVVMLRVLEGFSVRETATIMRCREGTVKALLSKGNANLKHYCETLGIEI
ncbi:MAG: RNA polymerase sigma factor [Halioglobus sp.]